MKCERANRQLIFSGLNAARGVNDRELDELAVKVRYAAEDGTAAEAIPLDHYVLPVMHNAFKMLEDAPGPAELQSTKDRLLNSIDQAEVEMFNRAADGVLTESEIRYNVRLIREATETLTRLKLLEGVS